MDIDIKDMRGLMAGNDCLVVGCGPSVNQIHAGVWANYWTLGCNRAVTFCQPDFGVCVEPPGDKEIWSIMAAAAPMFMITHVRQYPRTLRFVTAKTLELVDADTPHAIQLGQSPWYAAAAAFCLGFERVGLVGVDMTGPRFNHSFTEASQKAWGLLAEVAKGVGKELVNLNLNSKLTSVRKGKLDEVRDKWHLRNARKG